VTIKIKAADRGGGQAASKQHRSQKHNSIRSLLKALIVTAALRGVLPYAAADWLIQCGGMRDA
jgi:hypothetical protein